MGEVVCSQQECGLRPLCIFRALENMFQHLLLVPHIGAIGAIYCPIPNDGRIFIGAEATVILSISAFVNPDYPAFFVYPDSRRNIHQVVQRADVMIDIDKRRIADIGRVEDWAGCCFAARILGDGDYFEIVSLEFFVDCLPHGHV